LVVTGGVFSGIGVQPAAGAEDPDTATEYLAAFQSLGGAEAFQHYSEFESIRSVAVTKLQVGDFTSSERQRMDLLLRILRTFKEAYAAAQNGSTVVALRKANQTDSLVTNLRNAGGNEFAAYASIALDRFYFRLGEDIYQSFQDARRTPRQIRLGKLAATAYKRAGATNRFSDLIVKTQNLSATLQTDLRRVNATVSAARGFLSNCNSCGNYEHALRMGPKLFGKYAAVHALDPQVSRAVTLLANHGLSDRKRRIQALDQKITQVHIALAIASGILGVGFTVVVGIIGAAFMIRILAWERDLEDSRVDEILQPTEVRR
ncbi:MAG: hypothetical protein ABEI52_02175, partial [Halobacteriaceae archaeon]